MPKIYIAWTINSHLLSLDVYHGKANWLNFLCFLQQWVQWIPRMLVDSCFFTLQRPYHTHLPQIADCHPVVEYLQHLSRVSWWLCSSWEFYTYPNHLWLQILEGCLLLCWNSMFLDAEEIRHATLSWTHNHACSLSEVEIGRPPDSL